MKVVVIGSGYVGLVTGCCLAETGNHVICVDHDESKVAALRRAQLPFHEPGLDALLETQLNAGRIQFETQIGRAMPNADVVFLAVGTPPLADGRPNLGNLLHCVRELADTAFADCLVVVKSTVPVGTGDRIERMLNASRAQQPGAVRIRVASNPEFLAEGHAVEDFRNPARIVIGTRDAHPASLLTRLYAPFDPAGNRLMLMDRRSAEFAKYACNAMLAARISLVNELAGIAGTLGADIGDVCRVMKGDPRIGKRYLHPGIGYGGSCLPKDLQALISAAEHAGAPALMLRGAQAVNTRQRERLFSVIHTHFGGRLTGHHIAIWGLAFKPGTDDVRAAPSIALIRWLLSAGARVSAHDPVATHAAHAALGDAARNVTFTATAHDACIDADALVVMTEWENFREPDFQGLAACMRDPVIFDARGIYDSAALRSHGFTHIQLSLSPPVAQNFPKCGEDRSPAKRPVASPGDVLPE
ncbi:UDP-glucose/GDP-mannose dehydrogenase family protein [bacterium SGD-2]|nr:UDP-glucose/GDP-mannose dehydrogenase family protein [bacterium SGD-2]